jgi:pimeloyl-ACP methyl ester carboxylesterase
VSALDPDVKQQVDLATGIRMKYREAGDPAGEVVILLHGFTDTSRSFLPTLEHLTRLRPELYLLAPDQRGHGESSMPPAEGCRGAPEQCFHPADFAEDVIALMEAKGIDRAHLVGHSLGSGVAQEVALSHPERVKRLVLIGTTGRFAGNPALNEFLIDGLVEGPWKASLVGQGRAWPDEAYELTPQSADPDAMSWMLANWVVDPVADPAFLAAIAPETTSTALGTWIGVVRALNVYDNLARLESLSVPTLVLWPTQDNFFPESDQLALRAALDAAVRECRTDYVFKAYGKQPLPASGIQETDLGHNLQWGAPEGVALDLAAYLRDGGLPTADLYYADPQDLRRVLTAPGEAGLVLRERVGCSS